MKREASGPRRSDSIQSYLRETRALGVVAVLALIAGAVSDALEPSFWDHHALLAGLTSSLIVVGLTVAVVNEATERRNRERWTVLAQYVMLQLVGSARLVWVAIAEVAGLIPPGSHDTVRMGNLVFPREAVGAGAKAVGDTPRLVAAVAQVLASTERRLRLRDAMIRLQGQYDDVLAAWAAVMLSSDMYAEIMDRHVEVADDVNRIANLLYVSGPDGDLPRSAQDANAAGAATDGQVDDEQLAEMLTAVAQLAERLDELTVEVATRIVPIDWWKGRPGHVPSRSADRQPSGPGSDG
ncbi:MAG: hypothetical protein JO325_07505 [Solirubrobacterales bacterium]|nr:hypothetical protein [Solirubrobacterales bacterium]